jgi:poly-gamma-glutamate capsule biosynthesis protein CapA/YwtB (metallophosphatase superfamily)
MVAAIEAADEQADLVVVTVHWGVELDTVPRPEDVARATAMVEAGADMVFGHHSHRLNPLGFEEGAPVFWSLGNFVWPKLSEASSTTAVGRVEVARDGTIRACLIPAQIASPGRPVVTAPASCPAPPQSP